MRIGFCIRYEKCDATYMALQIIKRVKELGCDIEIYPTNEIEPVHPVWDKYITKSAKMPFWKWVKKGFSHLVFNEPVSGDIIIGSRKLGSKCYLLVLWEYLNEENIKDIVAFDEVICPSKNVAYLISEKTKANNIRLVQWEPGVPVTKDDRDIDPNKIGVIWSLEGSQCFHQEPGFLKYIPQILDFSPGIWLTIMYSSRIVGDNIKLFRKLSDAAGGRVELLKDLNLDKQQLMFGMHDITIWPTLVESVGISGLSSIYMGTPVVAFDYPVIGEFLKDNKNSRLVPCELNFNKLGVPCVTPDYKVFCDKTISILEDTEALEKLRSTTTHGLLERSYNFSQYISNLFDN